MIDLALLLSIDVLDIAYIASLYKEPPSFEEILTALRQWLHTWGDRDDLLQGFYEKAIAAYKLENPPQREAST